MNRKELPLNIDWNHVKLLELEESQVRLVLADGARLAMDYRSDDDLQHILRNISRDSPPPPSAPRG